MTRGRLRLQRRDAARISSRSDDPNFRPICISIGPDGALYFIDWHNPIIGHMQHHLRDPNRDHEHGRIYRITYEGRPLLKPPKIDGAADRRAARSAQGAGEPHARAGEDRARQARQRRKSSPRRRNGSRSSTRTTRTTSTTCSKRSGCINGTTSWTWTCSSACSRRPSRDARAAATRVLCYWRDRVPDALARFKKPRTTKPARAPRSRARRELLTATAPPLKSRSRSKEADATTISITRSRNACGSSSRIGARQSPRVNRSPLIIPPASITSSRASTIPN